MYVSTTFINAFASMLGMVFWKWLENLKKTAQKSDISTENPDFLGEIQAETAVKGQITRLRNARLKMLRDQLAAYNRRMEEQMLMDEIADLRGDIDDVDEGDLPENIEDALLMKILSPVLGGATPSSTTSQTETEPLGQVNFTDAQLDEIKAGVPKIHLQNLAKLDPVIRANLIRASFPHMDENSIARAVKRI